MFLHIAGKHGIFQILRLMFVQMIVYQSCLTCDEKLKGTFPVNLSLFPLIFFINTFFA